MSIQAGQYALQSHYNTTLWVGTGNVIAIYPPPSVPLKTLQEGFKDPFNIQPTNGGKYYVLETNGQFVGYNGTDVKLLPLGQRGVEWTFVQGNGTNVFRLGIPKQDRWWTTSGVDSTKVQLAATNKGLSQEWMVSPYKL